MVQKSDKWGLSFSLAEQTIMNRLSNNLKSAYIEAKVTRDPKVTMECVIFDEEIEDWQNYLSGKPVIDGRNFDPFVSVETCLTASTIVTKIAEIHQRSPQL